jgi:hypothetical protein
MWSMITCNWFNQNIKSLSNIQFEIKNKTLKVFLTTKWENFIILKKIINLNQGLWFLSFFPFELAPCLQVLVNHPQINHFFNRFVFLVTLYCKSPILTSHSSFHAFNSINDTPQKKVVTHTTHSWDVKNTHDLIDS